MRKIKLKNRNSKNKKTEENINVDLKKENKIITFLMIPIYISFLAIGQTLEFLFSSDILITILIIILLISLYFLPIIALFSIRKNYKEKRSKLLSWLIIITLFVLVILTVFLDVPYILTIGTISCKFISCIYISKLFGKKKAISSMLIYLLIVEYIFIFHEMYRTIKRYEIFRVPLH